MGNAKVDFLVYLLRVKICISKEMKTVNVITDNKIKNARTI